jgi:parallel beta-helix repeat protein
MKRKALALMLVMAVLASTVGIELAEIAVADPYIPPEEAPPGYRIYSNGTCTAENLRREGDVYTFTGKISGTIVIERDGVVLDGAGYTLQGDGSSYGIWLQDKSNVTIKNLNIRNFGHGVRFSHYAPDWHSGQTNPNRTTDCTIEACNITNSSYGITFYSCSTCSVLGNYVENNTYGMKVYGSGNTFRNNRIEGNQYNFWELYAGESDVDTSNTVDGKPIYYWVNQHNMTVPADAGTVILKRCSGIRVQNLNLTRNGNGITLYYTNNSRISGNNISDNYWGITVWRSNNTSIIGNQIVNNIGDGIEEYESESNTIAHNLIKNNKGSGIYHRYLVSNDRISSNQIIGNQGSGIFNESNNCTITDNYVFENAVSGISVNSNCVIARNNITSNGPKTPKYQGVGLSFRSNCTIIDNDVSKNNRGIWTYDGEGNIIVGNIVAYNNNEGIRFQGSAENNLIYRNNFIENNNNGAQATVDYPAPNAWDNGIEGNYWSDYKSTPYFINDKNQDNHPLLAPIEFAPLELPSVQPPPTNQTEAVILVVGCVASVAAASLGLLLYFKKRRR